MAIHFLTSEDKVKLEQQIAELTEEIDGLKEGETTIEEVTYNPDILGFWNPNIGGISTATGTAHTDYLSLEGVISIKASSRLSKSGYAVAFFDADMKIMSDVSVAGGGADADTVTVMDTPTGAAYVMLSDYRQTSSSGIGYITLYYAVSGEDKKPLKGKKINALGDSITSTDYTTPNWWQIIAEQTGAVFNNYGVSGSMVANNDTRQDSFVMRYPAMDTAADAVVIMGGTNDNNTPRGAWDSTDATTFFGALNALLPGVLTAFPGKPVIVCTPIQLANSYTYGSIDAVADLTGKNNDDTINIQLRAEAIKAKCKQYGITCIDLYGDSGINGVDAEKVYYRPDDIYHPSSVGVERMAAIIKAKLETLLGN